MEIDIGVENGRLEGYSSGSALSVERMRIDDESRYEEIAQSLVATLLEAHPDAERVTLEIDNHDERAASLLARWGFVPARRVLAVDVDVLRRDLERSPRGESFGSVHVQTDDLPAVQRAVAGFTPLRAGGSEGSVVIPPRGGSARQASRGPASADRNRRSARTRDAHRRRGARLPGGRRVARRDLCLGGFGGMSLVLGS